MAQKDCFVIAPIGDPESDTRKRSDQILKHVICPALDKCGYKATRADQMSEPGMITSQVIQHIVDDQLVIADLTDRNPNVFYELAIRHAIRKPLVQLIQKGEQIPFDVAGTRTIHVDHHDLDSVEEAKQEIVAQVGSLEQDPSKMETPISVSLDLQILKQSDNPEQRSLADALSVMSEVRSSIANVEKRLEHPESLIPLEYIQHAVGRSAARSPSVQRTAMHLRRIIDELSEIAASDRPQTAKAMRDWRKELEERTNWIRRRLDAISHDDW